jgi:hypothetical protein
VILVGICSYYLSCGTVLAGFPALARRALLEHLGWLGAPMLAAMSVRRRLHARPTRRVVAERSAGLAQRQPGGSVGRQEAWDGEHQQRGREDQGNLLKALRDGGRKRRREA